MNEKKTSILIPVFKLKEDRFRILKFLVINYLSKLNTDVFICEQVQYDIDLELVLLAAEYDNIHYLSYRSDKEIFYKAKLLNSIVKKIYSEYLWFLDADVFLNYSDIINNISNQDVIKPFNQILKLDNERTDEFIANKKLIIKKGSILESVSQFGSLTFIIKKEIYLKNKWEDLDFAYKLINNYIVSEFIDQKGLHLYHKLSENHFNEERDNQKILLQAKLKFGLEIIDD